MRGALDELPINGRIVIGAPEDEAQLAVGARSGRAARRSTSRSTRSRAAASSRAAVPGAMSMIAVGEPGSLLTLPDMYMRKMAVGPRARGSIDLSKPVDENVGAIADAFGRNVNDITTIVLDRPRHHDLIEEIRRAGARIKLIQDGDVTASISGGDPRHERPPRDRDRRHAPGGAQRRRRCAASAASCRRSSGRRRAARSSEAREHGIDDVYRVFSTEELAPGEVIVAATGVSNGDLLRGVRFYADSARTHSLVMCTRCNWVRFVDGIHFFRARAARGSAAARLSRPGARYDSIDGPRRTTSSRRCAQVEDPELGMDIVDLGLLYDVEVDGPEGEGDPQPHVDGLPGRADDPGGHPDVASALEGVEEVEVELTWEPPWTPERMSDDAKFILGFG